MTVLSPWGGQGETVVRLERVPLRLWERAAQHTADLLREFDLISLATEPAHVPGPPPELIADLQARYLGVDEQPALERQAAVAAGVRSQDVTHLVGPDVTVAVHRLLELLDEADEHCSRGTLMTLPSPPDQQDFRRWYLGEFVRQAAGGPPVPWPGTLD